MENFSLALEKQVQKKHLLNHSFYVRWQNGELSAEELRGYSKEYYAFESEFPRFLSAIHSRCEDASMRKALLENLVHEELGEDNHPELWLKFAEGMGVARENVANHVHSDETEFLLRTFRRFAQSEKVSDAIAALYAYEKQQPSVAATKIEGLQEHYNVREESTVAFFKAHQSYDVAHSNTEAELLDVLCQDEQSRASALAAVDEVCSALYEFLDGIERRYRPVAA